MRKRSKFVNKKLKFKAILKLIYLLFFVIANHNCFMGTMIKNSFETNFGKCKNANRLLENSSSHIKICLQSQYTERWIKQYIRPLNRNRIAIIYFNYDSIFGEMFNQEGKLIKSLTIANKIRDLPKICCTSEKILITFRHPLYHSNHLLLLYDSNFNLIKLCEGSQVDSVFMNQQYIVCSSMYKSGGDNCVLVYDMDFNVIETFGQQKNEEEQLYFSRVIFKQFLFKFSIIN